MKILVTPTCCTEVRQERAVVIVVDDPETLPWVTHWTLLLASGHDRYPDEDREWFRRPIPAPRCCPYCMTALPAIEPRPGITVPVWHGDSDYCATCGERNRECRCLPPWATFQPAGGDALDVNALWRAWRAWRAQYDNSDD